jgi:acyl-CoA thioesterase-1
MGQTYVALLPKSVFFRRNTIVKIKITIVLLFIAIAASASSKIKVACVGNSITAGTSNYPTYLQNLLGSGYQVENDGVGGTTMLKNGDSPYWTKGRLQQALAFKPNIVTIKLGTNDTKSQNWDAHYNEFKNDYCAMIDTFNSLTTKPDIFLVLPVPVFRTNFGIRDSILKKIIVIVKEIGTERNLPVIDANTPLLGFSGYFSDGIHPNTTGADTIAHIIYRALMARTEIGSEFGRKYPSASHGQHHRFIPVISFPGIHFTSDVMFDLTGREVGFPGSDDRRVVPPGLYLIDRTAVGKTER